MPSPLKDPLEDRTTPLIRQFGEALRRRRQALSLTLEDVSRIVGVNRRYIGELENGKPTCEIGRAFLVAQALGFSPSEFLNPLQPAEHDVSSGLDIPAL